MEWLKATLGVSFAPLDRGIEVDRVDLGRLRRESCHARAEGHNVRELVLCGELLPGHEYRDSGCGWKPVLGERKWAHRVSRSECDD